MAAVQAQERPLSEAAPKPPLDGRADGATLENSATPQTSTAASGHFGHDRPAKRAGRKEALTPTDIAAKVRQLFTTRPASNQVAWLRELEADPDHLALRADGRANLHKVALLLATSAWKRGAPALTTAGWDQLSAEADLNRATIARWLRWLQDHDYLAVHQTGRSWRYSPTGRNERATYVLLSHTPQEPQQEDPSVSPNCDPPLGSKDLYNKHAHAREARKRGSSQTQPQMADPEAIPCTKRERLSVAQTLSSIRAELRGKAPRRLRHLLAGHLAAGWSAAELNDALTVAPDGSPWTLSGLIRSTEGWMLFKLRAWDPALKPDEAARIRARVATFDEEHAARKEQAKAAGAGKTQPVRTPWVTTVPACSTAAKMPSVTITGLTDTGGDRRATVTPTPGRDQPDLVVVAATPDRDTKPTVLGFWPTTQPFDVVLPAGTAWIVLRGTYHAAAADTASDKVWLPVEAEAKPTSLIQGIFAASSRSQFWPEVPRSVGSSNRGYVKLSTSWTPTSDT